MHVVSIRDSYKVGLAECNINLVLKVYRWNVHIVVNILCTFNNKVI